MLFNAPVVVKVFKTQSISYEFCVCLALSFILYTLVSLIDELIENLESKANPANFHSKQTHFW